ncbi:MAG: hypothetical protein V2A54_05205, partial [Bacteroidota bacterium]
KSGMESFRTNHSLLVVGCPMTDAGNCRMKGSEDRSAKSGMESFRSNHPLLVVGCPMIDAGYGRMQGSEDRSAKSEMESFRTNHPLLVVGCLICQSRKDELSAKVTIKSMQVPSARPIHVRCRHHPSVADRKMNPLG